MSLTSLAVRRPVTTVATTLAVVLVGGVSLTQLPIGLLPDVRFPLITIRTSYPGAAATEVSRFVAEPVEQAIAAVPGLLELRSVSRNGQVTTTVRFSWGTDMPKTVLQVREKLDNVRGVLPRSAERPTLLTSDPGERPIAVVAVTGRGDLSTLARIANDVHARRLEQLPGVASVAVVGAPRDEIRIEVDPDRLRALGLTVEQVAIAVRRANIANTGGTIRRGQFRLSVRMLTELRDASDILAVPLGDPSRGVKLRDVAHVTPTTSDPTTVTRLDGKAAIGLVIYSDAGANTVSVTRDIERSLEVLSSEMPAVAITLVAAQAQFVTDALDNLVQEIWLGGALSLGVILLFLRDLRSSAAVALMVPLSLLVALVIIHQLDVSINVFSLGGLALGVGLLVDNAIVVAEAANRRRDETGEPWHLAAIRATDQVAGPLIAATLTTMMVFGPIIFVKGLTSTLFRDLSLSVVTSVGASLLLALTLMPVMIARRTDGTKRKPAPTASTRLSHIGGRMANLYERGVFAALDHPRRVLGTTAAVTGAAVWVAIALPKEILPPVDERLLVGALRLPEGTSLHETIRQVQRLEWAAAELGARRVYARVGLATDEEVLSGVDPGSSSTAHVIIPAPHGFTAEELAQRLRQRLPDLVRGSLAFDVAGQSEFGSLVGREGRLVKVEVSARTAAASQHAAEQVRVAIARLPGLTDVRNAFATTQPVLEVEYERERLAERGISLSAVSSAVSSALGGTAATELLEADRRTPVRVHYIGAASENLAAALQTTVAGVPVGQLVRITEARAPVEVVRIGQRPVTVVEALIVRGGTARATDVVRDALGHVRLDPGVATRVTGANLEQRRTTDQLSFVALLSTALVFLVLAGEFSSFTLPLVVILTVPLAAVGAILLLWLTGQSINAVSLIGIIVMIGMADNEAVVKIDAIERARLAGHELREAILIGGRQRLRAITMTSLTTITGVLPLVLGLGAGGALYQPLAASIIGGTLSSLLVTFFVLPVAYAEVQRVSRRIPGDAELAIAAPTVSLSRVSTDTTDAPNEL